MRDKQIEEMAKYCCIPCDLYDEGKDCTYYDYKTCLCAEAAKALYNAGYRKASDVAREIFEEIERTFFKHYDEQVTYSPPTLPYHTREALGFSLNVLFMEIEKLKKKYESEGEG